MHFGRFPRKTILAATLLFAFSSANASFVEQVGTPAAPLAVMGTYAADAAIKPGLKAVIPAGWQLFHHQSVELPSGLSWEKDDTWVTVLNKFASKNDIAVLIDWEKKQVFFRSTAMALQEQEKRQMITQAASTPLPAFKNAEQKPAAVALAKPVEKAVEKPAEKVAVVAAVTVASSASTAPAVTPARPPVTLAAALPATPVAGPTVAPAPVTAASIPAAVAPTTAAPVAAPVAVTVPADLASPRAPTLSPATVAAASVAAVAKHSVRPPVKVVPVVTAAPVTAADTKPAVAVMPTSLPAVAIAPASSTPALASVVSATAPKLAPVTAPVTAPAASPVVAAVAAPVAQASVSAPVVAVAAPGAVAFNREPVSTVVATAAAKHGYTVSWDAAQVIFPGPVTLLGADMGEDMNLVLRALGGRRAAVEITVYRSSNIVVVRDAVTGSAAVTFTDVPFSGRIREIAPAKPNTAVFAAQIAAPAPAPVRVTAAPMLAAAAVPVSTPAGASSMAPKPTVVADPIPAAVRPVPAYAAPVARVAAVPVAPVRATPEPARLVPSVAAIQKAEPVQPQVDTTGRVITLRVAAGSQLRDAIEAILEPGWSLKWDVKDELQANTELTASGESLKAVLNQVLPRLKLSSDIYKPSKLVIVREADQALDK